MKRSAWQKKHSRDIRLSVIIDAAGAIALFALLFAALHLPGAT